MFISQKGGLYCRVGELSYRKYGTFPFLNKILNFQRAVVLDGNIYFILTGTFSGFADPLFSILLSSYFWTILLECLICVISMVYRYFVTRDRIPNYGFVIILTFVSTIISILLGVIYFFSLAIFGNSFNDAENIAKLTQNHPFWRRKDFDYAVINTVSKDCSYGIFCIRTFKIEPST